MKQERDLSVLLMAIACALALLFTALFLADLPFSRAMMARRDYIVYWATGQQLARHANPYDEAAISRIERDAGFTGSGAYYMRNVPWALPLALPLGYVGAQAAALPWSLVMLGLLVASVRVLWKMLPGRPRGDLIWLGYGFPPALYCVVLGQTSILLLFGLCLFLRWYRTRPFAAGAALWFCTLKPHLFLPFVTVLLVWIVVSRNYRVLAGALAALAAGAAVTTAVDPAAWAQYAYYMRTSSTTREFTACFGDLLRDRINPSAEWLVFAPAILGCAWALVYFWRRRRAWDWLEHGNLLVLVSLLVAPFGWVFDQALALPAILSAAARTRSRAAIAVLALIYFAVEFQILRYNLHSLVYLWIAPAWIAWYIWSKWRGWEQ